jgi:5'-methylthioadenosine phosphorylase
MPHAPDDDATSVRPQPVAADPLRSADPRRVSSDPRRAAIWMVGALLSFSMVAITGREAMRSSGALELLFWRAGTGLFVLADQFVDRTFGRQSSFFGNGCVAHVSMAHPVAPLLQERIAAAARAEDIECKRGGTYVCMEGPQFSSYAESLTYKGLGYDVIGMTAMPEAKLAREAELSYAIIAMVTDYDCWHPEHDHVSVAQIVKTLHDNAEKAKALIAEVLPRIADDPHGPDCLCRRSLEYAIITPPEAWDPVMIRKLKVVAGRVLKKKK